MEYGITLLVLVAIAALYIARHVLSLWTFLSKAVRLPTTWPHPIFGHTFQFMGSSERTFETFKKIENDTGPLYTAWLVFPIVVMTKPNHIETILGSSKNISKSILYKILTPWLGTGLLTSAGPKWHSHRKMLTPAFHFKILENFVDVFSEKCQLLVKNLERELESEYFDVVPYISRCTLDIICETAMGVEINAQEQGEHSEYVNDVNEIASEITRRQCAPWLYADFIYYLTARGKNFKSLVKKMHKFTMEVIQMRKKLYQPERQIQKSQNENSNVVGIKKRLTFLDLLLETSNGGAVLTDEEIREEVDTFMFEGHDTTAVALSWTLHLLGSHPDIQEQVYKELETIYQGSDRSPTMEDLSAMKCLERVIKESLRLYPSVPIIGRRVEEDIILDGLTIPAGIHVLLIIYFAHRDPEQFPDPDKFNPDNFLPERVAGRHPYAYIPFSAGPRNCIGQKFALFELKSVLSYILRNYRVESIDKVPVAAPEMTLRPVNGVRLKITRR